MGSSSSSVTGPSLPNLTIDATNFAHLFMNAIGRIVHAQRAHKGEQDSTSQALKDLAEKLLMTKSGDSVKTAFTVTKGVHVGDKLDEATT